MNDEVSKALEWLRMLDATWEHAHAGALLAHLDGESARLAAAREEQRKACARRLRRHLRRRLRRRLRRLRPLDSKPLADEMAQVRKERDALKARVKELEEEQEARDDVRTAEQRLKFWHENPHACPNHFGARTACAQCFDSVSQEFTSLQIEHEATLRDLRAAEARVKELEAVLREVAEWSHTGHGCFPAKQCGLCKPLLAALEVAVPPQPAPVMRRGSAEHGWKAARYLVSKARGGK